MDLDHVEREFLDFGKEFGSHVAETDSGLLDFGLGGDAGKVVVVFDVAGDFGERGELVVRGEDVNRTSSS
jgi:hypothetical protein